MTALALKEQLHKAIDNIEDKTFLQAVYTIINEKSNSKEFELSASQKRELDKRMKAHKSGKSKSYSWESIKKELRVKTNNAV